MVPRGEIISIDNKQNYNQIFDIIKEESHSRLPVYENNLDNIVGFFHVKDFIKICENIFENNKIILEKKWMIFKELFDKKNISRKECLLLPIRTIEKALND